MIALLALSLALAGQAPVPLDDPGSSYCLATGFCRRVASPGPSSGVPFVAVGLVAAGLAGVRGGRRRPFGS